MKKLAALLFSFALVFGAPAGVFANADKDCSDFATWEEAQKYFEDNGGSITNNVDRLDNDGDGLACENLKGFDPSHKNPNNNGENGGTATTPPSHGGDNSGTVNTPPKHGVGNGNNDTTPPNNGGDKFNNGSNTGNAGDNNSGNTGNSGGSSGNTGNGNGGKLPKTATDYPTLVMAGALLLLAGAGLLVLKPIIDRK